MTKSHKILVQNITWSYYRTLKSLQDNHVRTQYFKTQLQFSKFFQMNNLCCYANNTLAFFSVATFKHGYRHFGYGILLYFPFSTIEVEHSVNFKHAWNKETIEKIGVFHSWSFQYFSVLDIAFSKSRLSTVVYIFQT